ncbi:tetratricopeptide repeat protein, partial [bacterium]|nr:tetratricopeptide repeat protein [bacterium]
MTGSYMMQQQCKVWVLMGGILIGIMGVMSAQTALAKSPETQAWIMLVKAMEANPGAHKTLNQAITFINHYPRSQFKSAAEYMVGENYFINRKYKLALAYYQQLLRKIDTLSYGDSVMFRLGECHFNLGKIKQAENTWNAMQSRFPKTYLRSEVEVNRCQILLKQEKYHAAMRRYRALLSRYPYLRDRKNILVGLARIDYAQQKYVEVLKRLARIKTPAALYFKGRSLFALKRYQEAANYFDKIEKRHPKHIYVKNSIYLKAESFFRANNFSAATRAYKKFLQRYPQGTLAYFARYKLTAVLLSRKKYNEALANINRGMAMPQQHLSAFFMKYLRAEIYVGLRRYSQAAELFREIVGSNPPEQILETCLVKYAWVLYKSKKYALAIKIAKRHLETFGGNERAVSAHCIIANSNYFMRNYRQALRTYRDILMQHPYSELIEIALVQMQITYLKTKQIGQIISQTSDFVKKMEEHFKPISRKYRSMALYFLGEAYYQKKRPLEAIALNEKIITKYWDTKAYAYAKEALVWAYFEQDQFSLALKEAEKVIKDRRISKTIRADIALVKGHCLFNLKRYKPALENYSGWLKKNPRSPERVNIQYLMGLAYYRLKYYKSAMKIWEKVIAHPARNEFNRTALLKVADTLFRGRDNPRARARYQLYIQRYPKGSEVPLAYLRIAQTYYNQGFDEKAINAYRVFIRRFPNHASCETAQDGVETTAFRRVKKNPVMKNLRNYLAHYPKSKFANQIQYQIADKYYKSKNYPIAIRELNRLILNYPGSEA